MCFWKRRGSDVTQGWLDTARRQIPEGKKKLPIPLLETIQKKARVEQAGRSRFAKKEARLGSGKRSQKKRKGVTATSGYLSSGQEQVAYDTHRSNAKDLVQEKSREEVDFGDEETRASLRRGPTSSGKPTLLFSQWLGLGFPSVAPRVMFGPALGLLKALEAQSKPMPTPPLNSPPPYWQWALTNPRATTPNKTEFFSSVSTLGSQDTIPSSPSDNRELRISGQGKRQRTEEATTLGQEAMNSSASRVDDMTNSSASRVHDMTNSSASWVDDMKNSSASRVDDTTNSSASRVDDLKNSSAPRVDDRTTTSQLMISAAREQRADRTS